MYSFRIAYIEFKSEADAEKNLEEKQGAEIDGRSVSLYYTGEKGQRQERTGKTSTWSGKLKGLLCSGNRNHLYLCILSNWLPTISSPLFI